MQTAFAESLSFRPNCQLRDFRGTFVSDSYGHSGRALASLQYLPEAAEEEARLAEPNGFVPIEEMADPRWTVDAPTAPPLKEEALQVALKQLLSSSPRWLVIVYNRALKPCQPQVLLALPKLVEELVSNGTYRPWNQEQRSFFKNFEVWAEDGCAVAGRILEALRTTAPSIAVH